MNISNLQRYRRPFLIALVVSQVLFLLGIVSLHYAAYQYGKEIRLQTVPVDPRDLFYGDYVRLQYEINQINYKLWKGAEAPRTGDIIYVVVRKQPSKNVYDAIAAYPHKPKVTEQETILKGRVQYVDNNHIISVQYGLEKYYVAEDTGKALEKQASHLIVKIKAPSWGSPQIEGIELEK
ncbi:hypothetical protein Back11_28810 [Paenibacillus baekrokdamisoli]|uniref:Uncharacterized protein n=1 Tax=Paenibacillus baekrokdamisoli TaxID=1712516 RepID=A0A3G9IT37_9BACL|nr:GDYXXLXY domain-containing protein [Paenibacillus baekrokdamisoli]MBB3071118.1 putative membrane-anchored protein [Paenibacillus baekrokdamisoli]BBH21536.1 hypothetical protein Back11_28810 [Paenibacillus baekrokdamisoli]